MPVEFERSHRRRARTRLVTLGVHPSKRLGQSFLVDPQAAARVIGAAELVGDETVVEIGPGLGALTERLAVAARRIVAVELDRRLAAGLAEEFADCPQVTIHQGDALTIDYDQLWPRDEAAVLVSSLPYAIVGPLLVRVLAEVPRISRLTVVVQREVGAKLAARPGMPGYGVMSLFTALHAEARVVGRLGRASFFPVPDVDSSIAVLRRCQMPPLPGTREQLMTVIEAGLGQRRKTLVNALSSTLKLEKPLLQRMLAEIGIDPGRRGETLDLSEFIAVAGIVDRATRLLVAGGGDGDEG